MEPQIYDAPQEYDKSLKNSRVPGNIPRSVMAKIQGRMASAVLDNPDIMASTMSKHMVALEQYGRMTKEEKTKYIYNAKNEDELRHIKMVEDDIDCLEILVARLRELSK